MSMRIVTLIAAALLLTGLCTGSAHATRELVRNPLLTEGKDDKPLHWKAEGYRMEPAVTVFDWSVDDSKIGVIGIESKIANDARYVQSVPVSPDTWYHVSGWGRAENVGATSMGLYLSVLGTFHNSRDLRGTLAWQPLSFWVKTGGLETKLQISCRLGGYSSLNTGKGWCTGISVMAAGSPEPSKYVYGSTAAQQLSGGAFGIQAIAVLVVLGALLLIWRYVLPPSKQIPE